MIDFPLDGLPPNPSTVNPLLDDIPAPLALPVRKLEDLGLADRPAAYRPPGHLEMLAERTLDCADLEEQGLWQTDDCCEMCHSHDPIKPAPLRHKHVTVRGCCASHEALNHLNPPRKDFIERLFR